MMLRSRHSACSYDRVWPEGEKLGKPNGLLALLPWFQIVSCVSPYQVEGDQDGKDAADSGQDKAEAVELPAVP